jgi:hypothetical protein
MLGNNWSAWDGPVNCSRHPTYEPKSRAAAFLILSAGKGFFRQTLCLSSVCNVLQRYSFYLSFLMRPGIQRLRE